jgi:hypoxanthine phosphoribosyltransferase
METTSRKILFARSDIDKRVREMADQISRDYAGGELIMIGVLKGAFVFMADLMRALSVPCRTDFIRAASYGAGTESSGEIVITKDIELVIEGCDVLVVDDIVDTGLTLRHIVDSLRGRRPRSLRVCAFLDKRLRRRIPFEADYVGFSIDDGFVVGYGLDFGEQYRFLPDVYVIEAGILKGSEDNP